jgi:hypothetical protein
MDQQWTEDSVARTLINPNYCLTQPPLVTEEKRTKANARLVQEMGAESYLATLQSVLRPAVNETKLVEPGDDSRAAERVVAFIARLRFGLTQWIASRSTQGSSADSLPFPKD